MRSTLYDTVSDRYPRFLRDEVLAEVEAKYNIRKDAYSHAITGLSSGGICSFNAAWQMPDQFSRVISWIGSFASIQWKEDPANPDGGQDYPEKVLREPKRNIRVWLQDGCERPGTIALRKLAAGQHPHGQRAQNQGLRLPFQLRQGHAQFRARGGRISCGDDLAMARLRPRQNEPELRPRPGRKIQTCIPCIHYQPRSRVAAHRQLRDAHFEARERERTCRDASKPLLPGK